MISYSLDLKISFQVFCHFLLGLFLGILSLIFLFVNGIFHSIKKNLASLSLGCGTQLLIVVCSVSLLVAHGLLLLQNMGSRALTL